MLGIMILVYFYLQICIKMNNKNIINIHFHKYNWYLHLNKDFSSKMMSDIFCFPNSILAIMLILFNELILFLSKSRHMILLSLIICRHMRPSSLTPHSSIYSSNSWGKYIFDRFNTPILPILLPDSINFYSFVCIVLFLIIYRMPF